MELGTPTETRLATRVGSVEMGNLLTFIQLVLPGAVKFYYGDELGMSDVPNDAFPNRGTMQWSDGEHGGFSSTENSTFFKTNPDYKTRNYEAQYSIPLSPLKTFQKLALLRQRDETLITGETRLAELQGDTFLLSRLLKTGNDTYGTIYVAVANFGKFPRKVTIDPKLLPDKYELGATAQIMAVTANITDIKPRQQYKWIENDDLKSPKPKSVMVPSMGGILFKLISD